MINGFYRIISNGEVVAESKNMITANGLLAINSFLSGQTRSWAGSLAIGTLNSASTNSATTALQYEIARYPVSFISYVAGSPNLQVVKATIDPSADFDIYEIGIIPVRVDPNSYTDNFRITTFSEFSGPTSNWSYNNGVSVTTASSNPGPRSGGVTLVLPVTVVSTTNTASIGGQSLDTSIYNSNDTLSLLYYSTAALTSSVTVTFGDSSSVQLPWTGSAVASPAASGFYGLSLPLVTKPAGWSDPVVSLSVTFYGSSGSVYLDHLKFAQGQQTTSEFQLASRTVAATTASPIFSKVYSQPMDIEYYIQVT